MDGPRREIPFLHLLGPWPASLHAPRGLYHALSLSSFIPIERILLLQVISMKHFIFCSIEDCVSD